MSAFLRTFSLPSFIGFGGYGLYVVARNTIFLGQEDLQLCDYYSQPIEMSTELKDIEKEVKEICTMFIFVMSCLNSS